MNEHWNNFLLTELSTVSDSKHQQCLYAIPHLSVLKISGNDAAKFLQGQVTCDVFEVTHNQSRLGAMCNAKGRVISTFLLVRSLDDFLLILPLSLLNPVKEKLQKYVLRADVTLTDASNQYCLFGVSAGHNDFLTTEQHNDLYVHFDQRDLIVTASDKAISLWQDYKNQGFNVNTLTQWQYLDLLKSIPWLTLETSEQFIPQMLNLDDLGGISYTKGCYTGQEIVARTHYLGKAKRALFLAEASITPESNTEIINQHGQAVGTVLNAVADKMLIVLQQESEFSTLVLKDYNVPITLLTVEAS